MNEVPIFLSITNFLIIILFLTEVQVSGFKSYLNASVATTELLVFITLYPTGLRTFV